MAYRPRFRRLLFLATVCLATVVVVEVLLLPVIHYAQQELFRGNLPADLAKPRTEDGFIKSPSLREQLLKQHNRSDQLFQQQLLDELVQEEQHEGPEENQQPEDYGVELTLIKGYPVVLTKEDDGNQGLLTKVKDAFQGVLKEGEPFHSPGNNTVEPFLSTSGQIPESALYDVAQHKNQANKKGEPRSGDVHENTSSTQLNAKSDGKYWFFQNGTIWPTSVKGSHDAKRKIWPHEAPESDRIVDQLMHIPEDYDPSHVMTVVLTNDLIGWNVPSGPGVFQECPVKACTLGSDADTADALLFRNYINRKGRLKRDSQKWIIYALESPIHTVIRSEEKIFNKSLIDWTATYRMDSDIVTPYEKWVYYDDNIKTLEANRHVNFAAGKTAQVAWFVSNCDTSNQRLQYAMKLQKYIPVDIYGVCGNLTCPRHSSHCQELLNTKYKFYLSFENSNCTDYITEKFFQTGLGNNILPIVMGAQKSAYVRSAPLNSFVHVDDFHSEKELAEYLHLLDKNDTLYNEYFQWKGTGELINTHFWCRLCTMLHDSGSGSSGKYADIAQWWHENTCRPNSWPLKDGGEDLVY